MPESLPDLEADRDKLFQQMQALDDFRPGSINVVVRRCGKSSCHCAQTDDAGHDPQFRLTRKANGKTVTESFSTPAAFRKAQREVTEFHRFQTLSADLIQSTRRSAVSVRPSQNRVLGRHRKKNGC